MKSYGSQLPGSTQRRSGHHWVERLLLTAAPLWLLIGCASPGEPLERKPPQPAAVTDLNASQTGNSVVLSFNLPKETVDHRELKHSVSVFIYRRFQPTGTVAVQGHAVESFPGSTLLVAIPAAMLDSYSAAGQIRYQDQLQAADFAQPTGETAQYLVSTSTTDKKQSPPSNLASLSIVPAPQPINDLKAAVTHSGIHLTWAAPARTLVGSVPEIIGYSVYRAEAASPTGSALATPLEKIADIDTPFYEDTKIEVGETYAYSVRSNMKTPTGTIESADSNLASVLASDITAPAPPQNLVAAPVPAQGETAGYVDLSWSASLETDTAGYNVYRSEQVGDLGTRLNTRLLPAPAFRDMTASPSHEYIYSVTAVDRSGNESAPARPVVGVIPAANTR